VAAKSVAIILPIKDAADVLAAISKLNLPEDDLDYFALENFRKLLRDAVVLAQRVNSCQGEEKSRKH
jgi:hypothetical protein